MGTAGTGGTRVAELRKERGITQVALARRAGVSVSLLSRSRCRPTPRQQRDPPSRRHRSAGVVQGQWPVMRSVGLVVPDVLALWRGGDTEAFVGRPTLVVPEGRGLLDTVPQPLRAVLARVGGTLHLEDCPDGVVDLLKLLGGGAAQVLDEAATWWAIDLQGECPTEFSDPHGQQ
jgi:helix-turn-helix protein